MISISMSDVLTKSPTDLDKEIYPLGPHDDTHYTIYVFRDNICVLYVGRSIDVIERLRQHLGIGTRSGGASIGRFYKEYQDLSANWQIDLYTLEDCESMISSSLRTIEKAETAMIRHLRPCLNIANNVTPSHLPAKYGGDGVCVYHFDSDGNLSLR